MPVLLFSFLVQLKWKLRLIACVLCVWASQSEDSAACAAWLRKGSSGHVASVFSLCRRMEVIFQSCFLSQWSSSGPSGPQFSVTAAELIQSWPATYCTMTLHLILKAFATQYVMFDPDWSVVWLYRYYPNTLYSFWNGQSIQCRKMPKRCQSLFNLNGRA